MEKIPGHKLKYYKKLSSTVASVARESSVSTFPALLRPQPNFLHPPIKEKPPPESTRLPRLSIVSKLCATLREFHQRCTLRVGLPCIDSVLAPSLGRKRRREDPYSKHVRYRRPKSQRQLELAQRPVKAPSAILTTTPHPQKPAYQHQRLLSIEKEENFVERKMKREAGDPSLELRRQESLIVDPTINNHISRTLPRKLYTPDGKVVHYVIPCHSDSSFTDLKKTTPEKTTHKMIQVNCESLLKIEIPQNELDEIKSESQQESAPEGLAQLPPVPDDELGQPGSSPVLKRVTFADNLIEEFDEILRLKATTTTVTVETPTELRPKTKGSKIPNYHCTPIRKSENWNKEGEDSVMNDDNLENQLPHTPHISPSPTPRLRKSVGGKKSENERNPSNPRPVSPSSLVAKHLREALATKSSRIPTRSQFLKEKFVPVVPPVLVPKYNRVTESWFPGAVDRESWDRQKPLRAAAEVLSKKELQRDLHLKYGRFPKVLQMKKELLRPLTATTPTFTASSTPSSPRVRKSMSRASNSFSSTSVPASYFHEEESPSTRLSSSTVVPEIKSKKLRTRLEKEESRLAETVKKGLLARNVNNFHGPLLTRRLVGGAIGGDNWLLANPNQVFMGNSSDKEPQEDLPYRPPTAF